MLMTQSFAIDAREFANGRDGGATYTARVSGCLSVSAIRKASPIHSLAFQSKVSVARVCTCGSRLRPSVDSVGKSRRGEPCVTFAQLTYLVKP